MTSKWTKTSLSVPEKILEHGFLEYGFLKTCRFFIMTENLSMSDGRDRKLKK